MYSALVLVVFTATLVYEAKGQGTGSVRLYNNGNVDPTNTNGVVQVYFNNRWGTICDLHDSQPFGIPDTVCRQLGYSGGSYSSSSSLDSTPPVIGDVSCDRSNLVILQCSHQSPSNSCTPSNNIQVSCYSTRIWDQPISGMVRLQDGYYTGQGRVEVYCNGEWGAVCGDSGFNRDVANTVCKQLGYNSHINTGNTSYTGIAWLANVNCASTQNCISYCASCPSHSVTCSAAANVTCSYNTNSKELGNTRYTCGFYVSGLSKGEIAGIIIASIAGLIGFCLCVIGIPLCICCCLGVGIGAATSRPKYSHI